MAPSQDSSDHQDYYSFSRKSRTKPSFATVTGIGGHTQHNISSRRIHVAHAATPKFGAVWKNMLSQSKILNGTQEGL